jgi:hypothetical protein
MSSTHNLDHGLYIAEMNITFNDNTLKEIKNLTASNRTMISIRYRYKLYGIYDPSSSIAFIDIKESNFVDSGRGWQL